VKTIEYGKGNREHILFLHGGGLSWWNFQEAAEQLADRFHIVMPILDGHSGSDASFTSIEDNATKIISYIDEHFDGQVLLIGGVSLGGQILVEMLSQRSDICRFAVAESALVLPIKSAALIKSVYSVCYPLIKKRWFAKLQFRALRIKTELFEHYYADTSGLSKTDLIAFLIANSHYSIKETLADCKAEVLVLAGNKEQDVMKKSARMLANRLPTAHLEILHPYHHGELSLNHSKQYTEKILQLIHL